MSWRDSLRPGSWRGAAFSIRVGSGEGGRRGQLHEFPDRDEPFFEDLGRAGRRYQVEAIVIGPDYMAGRDRLLAACDLKGPGALIHPFLGTLNLVCEHFSWTESTAEGGMATFQLEFVEAGRALAAEVRADTVTIAAAAAERIQAAAPARFATVFSIDKTPIFVEDGALGLIRKLTDAAAIAGARLGGSGIALRAFEAGLAVLPKGARSLMRRPLALGQAVVGLVTAVGALGFSAHARVAALRRLLDDATFAAPVIGATPSRNRERTNQAAFLGLVSGVLAAETVRAASGAHFSSYNEAEALRTALADHLDRAAIAAADAGDVDGAAALDELRLVMIRDVGARGGSLARLHNYRPAETEPALVIAQRLYGAPEAVIEQAVDISTRNRVRHPGFVPGGADLEVRANG